MDKQFTPLQDPSPNRIPIDGDCNMGDRRNYYEILGTLPNVSREELAHFYHIKCRLYHPDSLAAAREYPLGMNTLDNGCTASSYSRQGKAPHLPANGCHKGEESLKEFKLIQKAYDILSDDAQRAGYDRWLGSGLTSQVGFETYQRMTASGGLMHWRNPPAIPRVEEGGGGSHLQTMGADEDGGEILRDKFKNYQI